MNSKRIRYAVSAPDPSRHTLHVKAIFSADALPEPLVVAMPVWAPGSYLVREFARHVERMTAHTPEGEAGVRKVRKDAWAIAHGGASEVTVEYDLYANDLTVRTNHVDDTHAFFNGAATFVRPVDAWDATPCEVELIPPSPAWSVVTSLTPTREGTWRARDFDELVDSPVEMGLHDVYRFRVADRDHALVVWGAKLCLRFDPRRLVDDLARVLEAEVKLYGEAPYERYTFFLQLTPGGRGGLEHAQSAVLQAGLDAFETEDAYHDLLALFAHEFLHLWHVKRVKPAGLTPVDYAGERYTRALWLFEGATSYYDRLALRRAEVVTPTAYLKHLAGEIARLEDTPGRLAQSLEEASFDAWIKLYRGDENTINATVSYYLKGEVVSALLDLEIRARTGGQRSLDDVFRHLWREHGITHKPVPESGFEAIVAAATDCDLSDVIDAWVRTTESLPYADVLARVGLTLRHRPGRGAALGIKLRGEHGRAVVASVLRGGAADRAGVCAGDEIIGFNRRRVDETSLRERLRRARELIGQPVALLVARREELRELTVTPAESPPEAWEIVPTPGAPMQQRRIVGAWLGEAALSLWG